MASSLTSSGAWTCTRPEVGHKPRVAKSTPNDEQDDLGQSERGGADEPAGLVAGVRPDAVVDGALEEQSSVDGEGEDEEGAPGEQNLNFQKSPLERTHEGRKVSRTMLLPPNTAMQARGPREGRPSQWRRRWKP